MNKICLNMIVKNESQVIERCLASVKSIISYWVIVDTGSTDGTQDVIKEFMKDIPGELHERPWVDFAYNRNEALELAKDKADYLLFIDADDVLEIYGPLPKLDKDIYFCYYKYPTDLQGYRNLMINTKGGWKWKGVLHEFLVPSDKKKSEFLKEVALVPKPGGARSLDDDKHLRDARILEKGLEEEPNSTRYAFQLANCYEEAKKYDLALKYYEKRAEMGGAELEVFFSLMQVGAMQEKLGMSQEAFTTSYLKAYKFLPTRVESLHQLVGYFIKSKQYLLGYLLSEFALSVPLPDDYRVYKWIYEWGVLLQFSECAIQVGKRLEAYESMKKLLTVQSLPSPIRNNVEKTLSTFSF